MGFGKEVAVREINFSAGIFNENRADRFRDAFIRAVASKENSFVFEDHLFLTDFARHLVSYLNSEFPEMSV